MSTKNKEYGVRQYNINVFQYLIKINLLYKYQIYRKYSYNNGYRFQ